MVDIVDRSRFATAGALCDIHHIARSVLHQIEEGHRIAGYAQEASTSHGPSIRPPVSSTPSCMQLITGRGRGRGRGGVERRGRAEDGGAGHGVDSDIGIRTLDPSFPTSIPSHTYLSPSISHSLPPHTCTSPSIPPHIDTSHFLPTHTYTSPSIPPHIDTSPFLPTHTYTSPSIPLHIDTSPSLPPHTYTSPSLPPHTYTTVPYPVSPEPTSIPVDITLMSHPLPSHTLPPMDDTILDLLLEWGRLPARRPRTRRVHRLLHPSVTLAPSAPSVPSAPSAPSVPSAPSAPSQTPHDPIAQQVVYSRLRPKRTIKAPSCGTH